MAWKDTWSNGGLQKPRKEYLVLACTNCGRYLLGVSDKVTRTCPYCGKRVRASDAKIVARSEDPREARRVLQEAKTQDQQMKSASRKTADNVTNLSEHGWDEIKCLHYQIVDS